MPNDLSSSQTLAEFYRFAVLLTGRIDRAEEVMANTLSEADTEIAQLRNETSRRAWFATRIREHCAKLETVSDSAPRLLRPQEEGESALEILEIEAYLIAQRFHRLPEPERSALALFYLDSFTNEDIAKLLKLHEDDLADTLGRARTHLRDILQGAGSQS